MLRRRRPRDPLAHIRPDAVSPRFARAVADALEARRRYVRLVEQAADGPRRDRLVEIGTRLDAGVAAVWDAVQRAMQLEQALVGLDADRAVTEYKEARRRHLDPEIADALRQRFASVQRLLNALDDTDTKLRLLDARLGAAVAQTAEILLTGGGIDRLDVEFDSVLTELGALRSALDALG